MDLTAAEHEQLYNAVALLCVAGHPSPLLLFPYLCMCLDHQIKPPGEHVCISLFWFCPGTFN